MRWSECEREIGKLIKDIVGRWEPWEPVTVLSPELTALLADEIASWVHQHFGLEADNEAGENKETE